MEIRQLGGSTKFGVGADEALLLDQTTPQTTVGTFTFPELVSLNSFGVGTSSPRGSFDIYTPKAAPLNFTLNPIYGSGAYYDDGTIAGVSYTLWAYYGTYPNIKISEPSNISSSNLGYAGQNYYYNVTFTQDPDATGYLLYCNYDFGFFAIAGYSDWTYIITSNSYDNYAMNDWAGWGSLNGYTYFPTNLLPDFPAAGANIYTDIQGNLLSTGGLTTHGDLNLWRNQTDASPALAYGSNDRFELKTTISDYDYGAFSITDRSSGNIMMSLINFGPSISDGSIPGLGIRGEYNNGAGIGQCGYFVLKHSQVTASITGLIAGYCWNTSGSSDLSTAGGLFRMSAIAEGGAAYYDPAIFYWDGALFGSDYNTYIYDRTGQTTFLNRQYDTKPTVAIIKHTGGQTTDLTTWFDTNGTTKLAHIDADGGAAFNSITETTPTLLKLDQTTPQTLSGGAFAGSGLLNVTSGLLGVDTNTYLTSQNWTRTGTTLAPTTAGNRVLFGGATDDTSTPIQVLGSLKLMTSAVAGVIGDVTGNARGAYSVDFQMRRTNVNQVASGDNSVAIGSQNRAAGTGAVGGDANVAIGILNVVGTDANNQYNVAIGSENSVNGVNNVAIGPSNKCTPQTGFTYAAQAGLALGLSNEVFGLGAVAVGGNNFAYKDEATVIGGSLKNSGLNSTAIGNSIFNGENSTIMLGVSSVGVRISGTDVMNLNADTYIADAAAIGTEVLTAGAFPLASLGAEMFTNFTRTSWTLTGGWDATNAGDTKINKNADGTTTATLNTVAAGIGTTYRVKINIDTRSGASGATVVFGGVTIVTFLATSGANGDGTGSFEASIIATATTGFVVTPTATANRFSINSISIKTYPWTFGSRWVLTEGAMNKYGFTAGSGGLTQPAANWATPLIVGRLYKVSITITASAMTATAQVLAVTIGGVTLTPIHFAGTVNTHTRIFKAVNTTGAMSINMGGTGSGAVTITNVSVKPFVSGNMNVYGGINSLAAQTVVNGSVAGTATFAQPNQGMSYKKVIIYCNALNGTASYTFPTAFVYTPQILSAALGAIPTTLSNTAVTLTGAVTTGFIELTGY